MCNMTLDNVLALKQGTDRVKSMYASVETISPPPPPPSAKKFIAILEAL
jgi:hypothetical protein